MAEQNNAPQAVQPPATAPAQAPVTPKKSILAILKGRGLVRNLIPLGIGLLIGYWWRSRRK